MRLFGKDLTKEIVFIAEIGVNHEGDPQAAERLLRLAAAAGADAVKLQSYTPDRYASAADPARLERVGRFALDEATHRRLAATARDLGVPLFSTPLSEDVVPLLDALFPVFKIASGDVTFAPTIRAAARTGKPIILSTGAATADEIDQAVDWVRAETGDAALADRLALMQCTSLYPADIAQTDVGVVGWLAARYGLTVGYSNHALGPEACLAAIALGASIIEVHFTDDRRDRTFHDHALSFEPAEFRALTESGRRVRAAVGDGVKKVQPGETAVRPLMRKGVMAARDLPAGTVLTAADLMFARPATHIAATEVDALPGRRLIAAVGRGMPLAWADLAPTDAA
jgi:N,N'-diacetyllegionaminate synthase